MVNLAIVLCLIIFSTSAFAQDFLFVEGPESKAWSEWSRSEELNLQKLIQEIKKSPFGEELVQKAMVKTQKLGRVSLGDVLQIGTSSLTDTTLTRKFSSTMPDEVTFETSTIITINRSLSWKEAILDLAHELTHFIERDPFNPYLSTFSVWEFIQSTIEHRGGEAHAFVNECKVYKDLFSKDYFSQSQCNLIENSQDSYQSAIELFYHVGPFFEHSKNEKLTENENQLRYLKPDKIKFISSAYGLPYPLAAIKEFKTVMNKVCENDRRRLQYLKSQPQRTPASLVRLEGQIEMRCSRLF